MNDELDTLLAAALPPIADDGFSAKLSIRAQQEKVQRQRREIFTLAGVCAAICFVMPLTDFGRAVNSWVLQLGDTANLPLAITAGAALVAALVARYAID